MLVHSHPIPALFCVPTRLSTAALIFTLGFAGGVGQLLLYTGLLEWNSVSTIALFTIVVVWAMDCASARSCDRLA